MKKNNIVLIGFMGVGKGTIARALAKTLKSYTIDTDDLIECLENKKIKDIFEEQGEPYFRNLEKKTAKWLKKNVKNTIISTGGGFYKQEEIKSIGKIVYLYSSFEELIKRLENSDNAKKKFKKRPLLSKLDEAKKLYDLRIKEYENLANIIINVENKSEEQIVLELIKELEI